MIEGCILIAVELGKSTRDRRDHVQTRDYSDPDPSYRIGYCGSVAAITVYYFLFVTQNPTTYFMSVFSNLMRMAVFFLGSLISATDQPRGISFLIFFII